MQTAEIIPLAPAAFPGIKNRMEVFLLKLTVNPAGDGFLSDGRPFFYLADTCWSAFTNAAPEEWEEYLDFRKKQGFNALQINILPQWDRSETRLSLLPFAAGPDGKYDYFHPDESYFARAQRFLETAVERGFLPALAVLWCDHVPGTWASRLMPDHIMPLEAVEPYAAYAAEKFSRFHPVYLVSGDTNFETPEAVKYYVTALETIKSVSPDALTTLHLSGGLTDLPEELEVSPLLDFYMYQSSHGRNDQHLAYEMAEAFYRKAVKRPVINGEPCYEGHGFGNEYGRFSAFDVRKAVWSSLLSGAKAGAAYGAHGVWSFHKKGDFFPSEAFSGTPFPWRTALRLPGAEDMSFARRLFEGWGLADLEPAYRLTDGSPEIRTAAAKDGSKIAVYIPYAAEVKIGAAFGGLDWTLVDLRNRRFQKPDITVSPGKTDIGMYDGNGDVLVVGRRLP